MEVKIFTLLQIALFIVLGIHLIVAGPENKEDEESDVYELFSVEYCGTNCTQQDTGSWTKCSGNCTCYHEDGKKVGLCLSTEYTDFTQFSTPTSEEIANASPRPKETNSH
uniref:Putative secreted protein n=1 Tax=Ixodes ricinus TaxID=34613 RepID=V5GZ04_IXORI